jgi:hypothetical protein
MEEFVDPPLFEYPVWGVTLMVLVLAYASFVSALPVHPKNFI